MKNLSIKEITNITAFENNKEIKKTKMVICQDGVDTEIILEGNGSIKVAATV